MYQTLFSRPHTKENKRSGYARLSHIVAHIWVVSCRDETNKRLICTTIYIQIYELNALLNGCRNQVFTQIATNRPIRYTYLVFFRWQATKIRAKVPRYSPHTTYTPLDRFARIHAALLSSSFTARDYITKITCTIGI